MVLRNLREAANFRADIRLEDLLSPSVAPHDFPDPQRGKAVPYGVYDIHENEAPTVDLDNTSMTVTEGQRVTNTGTYSAGGQQHPEDATAYLTSDIYRLSATVAGRGWRAELPNALTTATFGAVSTVKVAVATKTDLVQPAQFGEIVVKTVNGFPVKIRDVARVEEAPADQRSGMRLNGRSAIGTGVIRQATANPLDLSKGVREMIPKLKQDLPRPASEHQA